MSTAIVHYGLEDMTQMAEAVARSGLFGMKSWEQALALMLVAQSENQHPATITQEYDIIQGKACRKTHSVMARFQQMGGKVEWHELTDTIADATFSHPAGGAVRLKWTFEQAKKANLTNKDNWKNYPRAMLRARCIAEGVRTVYPAAIGGMLVAEEAQDVQFDATPSNSIKTDRNPQAAAAANAPDGYDEYEQAHLTSMQEAALNGSDALAAAFAAITKSPHKAAFWAKHKASLKEAAEKAVVIDQQTGEVTQA